MITIGEIQISGMLTMAMLALVLVLRVPIRSAHHPGFAHARWLMVAGTSLVAFQFLLQHQMGLRQMGVTQAVFVNLLLFMPASLLINMAVLYVQRSGKVGSKEWIVGGTFCGLAAITLLVTVFFDGVSLPFDSMLLRRAEYVGAGLYMLMQCYFFMLLYREYQRLQQAVDEYYDRERKDLLRWMGLSVRLTALLTLFIPFAIFFEGLPLVLFSVVLFFSIFYCVISLYSYGISEDSGRVEEAMGSEELGVRSEECVVSGEELGATSEEIGVRNEKMDDGEEEQLSDEQRQRVEQALEKWTADGGFRQHNLTLGIVARELHVPLRHLQLWLRHSEYKKLATLMNRLRIDYAQRLIQEHPEWSTESVADFCGFSSRQYFHQVFVQITGTTPAKFQKPIDR